jgi:hypothetical protein
MRKDSRRKITKMVLESPNSAIIPCSLRAGKPNGTRFLRRREADLQGLERVRASPSGNRTPNPRKRGEIPAISEKSCNINILWRRRRDSNPRDPFGSAPLAGACLRPLGHVSACPFIGARRWGQAERRRTADRTDGNRWPGVRPFASRLPRRPDVQNAGQAGSGNGPCCPLIGDEVPDSNAHPLPCQGRFRKVRQGSQSCKILA